MSSFDHLICHFARVSCSALVSVCVHFFGLVILKAPLIDLNING